MKTTLRKIETSLTYIRTPLLEVIVN